MNTRTNTLLVALDAGEASARAVALAIPLGGPGARIELVHVVDSASIVAPLAQGAIGEASALLDNALQEAHVLCGLAARRVQGAGLTAVTTILHGEPAAAILLHARDTDPAMIVVGTHARTRPPDTFAGSITETIVGASTAPVVLAHADDANSTGAIAAAIDGSAPGRAAFLFALQLAIAMQRPLKLIYVDSGTQGFAPTFIARYRREAKEARVHVHTTMCGGDTATSIVRCAESFGSALIVVGTHRRNDLDRPEPASVATAVINAAHIPVAVVRSIPALEIDEIEEPADAAGYDRRSSNG